jgi:hypothetical protein
MGPAAPLGLLSAAVSLVAAVSPETTFTHSTGLPALVHHSRVAESLGVVSTELTAGLAQRQIIRESLQVEE